MQDRIGASKHGISHRTSRCADRVAIGGELAVWSPEESGAAAAERVRFASQHRAVPTICRFYGISIQMFFKEHGVAHFHARYGDHIAVFAVESLEVIRGGLPKRAERLVREWASLHRVELMRNWERARAGEPLAAIDALE